MNKIFKILVLIVYTFAVFTIAFLIVSATNKGVNFKDYADEPSDENLAVITQILEKRENSRQNGTDYEKSVYDLYFYVKKIRSVDLKNIFIYVAVETEEGITYVQSSTKKDLTSSSSVISTISILNSSKEFAVNKIEDNDGEITQINKIPENLYIKVSYDEVKDSELMHKEFNFKIKYDDIDKEKFNDFEERDVITEGSDSGCIQFKQDYLKLKFIKIYNEKTDKKPAYNDYRISSVKKVSSNLPLNVSIKSLKIEVTAEITNESLLNEKYFSKYVKLFVYEGDYAADIANSRTVSLAEGYKVEKVYFNIEVELENGNTEVFKYFVSTNKLLDN